MGNLVEIKQPSKVRRHVACYISANATRRESLSVVVFRFHKQVQSHVTAKHGLHVTLGATYGLGANEPAPESGLAPPNLKWKVSVSPRRRSICFYYPALSVRLSRHNTLHL